MKELPLVVLILLAIGNAIVRAREIEFTATVDRNQVQVGEQLTLTLTVSGGVGTLPTPKLPELPNFSTYSAGRSSNISIINGKISASTSFNYILVPNNEGTYTIPSLKLNYKAKVYRTQPITITVGQAAAPPPPRQGRVQPVPSPSRRQVPQHVGRDLFLEGTVDKNKAYVGEQITYTLRFYRRVRLTQNPQYKPPELAGFWVEDLPPQRTYRQVINGVEYVVVEIKTALFGLSPGKKTIGRALLNCVVAVSGRISPFDFDIDKFFSRGKEINLQSQPVNIEILPLPVAGRPEDFSGAVGDFSLSGVVDKQQVKTNEPINLEVKIAGLGQVKDIGEPEIKIPEDFKLYDSGSSSEISKKDYKVGGSKTYKKILVPQVAGDYTIAPIEFCFFDPARKVYRRIKTKALKFKILPGPIVKAPSGEEITPYQKEIKIVGADIRYIKTGIKKLVSEDKLLINSQIYRLLHLFPLIFFLALVVQQKQKEKLSTDISYARLKLSRKVVKKGLAKARRLADQQKPKEFYAEISRTILEYIGHRLNISSLGMTNQQIKDILIECGMAEAAVKKVIGILETCDFARFAASSSGQEEMRESLAEAREIIGLLRKV